MDETENFGIIYKITNLKNGKIYIGKTKQHYGDNKKVRGIQARFRTHLSDARNNRNYCKKLCRAIRKHGAENFTIEELFRCTLDKLSDLETETIKKYNSTDKKIGYNITSGGGSLNCPVSEKTRQRISKTQNGDLNVTPIKYKGVAIGYRAHRKEKGEYYYKRFGSTENSLDENYKLAQEWLDKFKSNTLENKRYIKESKLPTNITHKRLNGEIAGYRVNVRIDNKLYSKDFVSNKETMEVKLNKAIEFKNSIKNGNNN